MVRITHRAGWILVDPWTIIENGYVRVCNGLIEEVGQGHPGGGHVIDHGPGANALNVEDSFGTLDPGKSGQFVYVPVNVSGRKNLLEAIVNADFTGNCKVIN